MRLKSLINGADLKPGDYDFRSFFRLGRGLMVDLLIPEEVFKFFRMFFVDFRSCS
jgi:hypothetical protein